MRSLQTYILRKENIMETVDASIHHPALILIHGRPQSGKSYFTYQLIKNRDKHFDKKIDNIVWFYGEKTSLFEDLKKENVRLIKGIPESFEPYIKKNSNNLFILDDLMKEVNSSSLVTNLFCNKSHHSSISCIYNSQNMFESGRERVTIYRCAQYIVLFHSPLDNSVARTIANKVMPHNTDLFYKIYNATAGSKPFGYLFIDGHNHSSNKTRFRTDLFEKDYQTSFVIE
jgi:hypothetical protein